MIGGAFLSYKIVVNKANIQFFWASARARKAGPSGLRLLYSRVREVVVEEGCGQPQEEAEVMQAASRPPALLKHMMQQAVQQEQEGQQEQEVQ